MNIHAPSLVPLFRSDMQGEVLAHLFLDPDHGYTVAELARLTSSAYASVHREVQRVVRAGWVTTIKVGQATVVQAKTDTGLFLPLAQLLAQSYGPVAILPRLLADVPGVTTVEIYGSWAELRLGTSPSVPRDIDVLVVGNPDRTLLDEKAREAEGLLRKEVNIRIFSDDLWRDSVDPFVLSLRSKPRVNLTKELATWSPGGSRGDPFSTA